MNRVDFATLNLTVAEDYKQLRIAPDSTLARFRNAAVEGYKRVFDGIISVALVVLPTGPVFYSGVDCSSSRFASFGGNGDRT